MPGRHYEAELKEEKLSWALHSGKNLQTRAGNTFWFSIIFFTQKAKTLSELKFL
jgi:hypothetical protein